MIVFVVLLCDVWISCSRCGAIAGVDKVWMMTMRIDSWKGDRQCSPWRWKGQRAKRPGCWASDSILMSCGILAGRGMERNLWAGSLMSERVMLGSWVADSEEEWEEAWLDDRKLRSKRSYTGVEKRRSQSLTGKWGECLPPAQPWVVTVW